MKKIDKIIVPIDFSETSDLLMEYAVTFVEKFGAKLYIIHIVEDFSRYSYIAVPHVSLDRVMEEILKVAEMELKDYCSKKLEGKTDYELILSRGDAYKEILRFSEEKDADLILIGSHGQSGLERVLFGSTAERVIRNAKCPIMMINIYHMSDVG
ncbi:MAG: universal stress protein [Deltaproteobacteria bacterium]|uniref:Universal stress protein n=1 Tax=Candidatus Zymogenus saltonus TaxID=2844893 RepID=A0A9D8PJJ9_9DELT|nr:universal stress protein [Candidatus Zymogenus saltonus]